MPSLHPCLLRLGLCLFPHLSTTQRTSPPLFSHPQPVNTHLVHSPTPPHTYAILYPTSPPSHGCESREDEGCIPPRIRQHPPNTFNVQVAYRYLKLGISKRDDLFLVFTSFWAKNWASATFCFFVLHFILTKNWASAEVSILLNHPPIAQHRFAPPPLHPQHLFPPCTPVSFD